MSNRIYSIRDESPSYDWEKLRNAANSLQRNHPEALRNIAPYMAGTSPTYPVDSLTLDPHSTPVHLVTPSGLRLEFMPPRERRRPFLAVDLLCVAVWALVIGLVWRLM